MSKFYLKWIKQPAKLMWITGLIYFAAVGVKAAYFGSAWYKFW